MSPRILGSLVVAVAFAAAAFGFTILSGGGFLLALAAYSSAGSLVLLGTAVLAALAEGAGSRRVASGPGPAFVRLPAGG